MEPQFNTEFGKFKRTTTKAFTEVRPTPVILVCIYNHNNTLISHDLLHTIFSPYGKVLRILIFEKVKVWKAFIEFANIECAFEAKRNLNDFLLFNDGTRLNVYFSNLDTIRFQNNNPGGMSYVEEEEGGSPEFIQNPQNLQNLGQRNEMIGYQQGGLNGNMFPQNNQRQEYPISPNPMYDDKGDEILKIINEHQQQKDHTHEDEEKNDGDDSEKTAFNPYMLDVFRPQPKQPVINEDPSLPKPRTSARPFEESDAIQRPIITRHSGHKHTAPPGLGIYPPTGFIPQQNDNRRILPFPGSHTPPPLMQQPTKNVQVIRPSTFHDLPKNIHPLNPRVVPFDPRQSYSPTNIPNYGYREHNTPTRLPQTSPYIPTNSNVIESQDQGEASPDSLTHQNLFDLIEKDIASEITARMKNLDLNAGTGQQSMNPSQDPNAIPNYENPLLYNNNVQSYYSEVEDKKSQVLYVKGLEDPNMTIQMIYNLFSNFGNVLKVIFIRNKAAALLEYENAEYATIAKDYLNNIVLMNKTLRIFYSNYSIINLRYKKPAKDSPEEILIGNPKTFRFKRNKNISINPPSATLHISNLAQEMCNEENITRFFGPYGTILALKYLLIDNSKYQCLMKMSSIEESINIMAILHDMEFGGRRVQLSFTRSKI